VRRAAPSPLTFRLSGHSKAACSVRSELEVVTVRPHRPIVDVAPIYLGKQKGFFSNRNIELTLETGQGGAAIVPGVVSGQFQFGFSNVTSLLIARERGLPLKVVSNGVASTGKDKADYSGVVTRDDSIKTAADLEGKRVAVNTLKNIGDSTIRASVRKAGGDPSWIKFVELPFPDMPAALEAGRVDAIWVVEPFLSAAVGAGGTSPPTTSTPLPTSPWPSTSPPSSSPRTTPTWSRGSPRR
jgi:ABC-type nitrate/sulfonate/bicarbonate transport system substrate-binding protein